MLFKSPYLDRSTLNKEFSSESRQRPVETVSGTPWPRNTRWVIKDLELGARICASALRLTGRVTLHV